MTDKEKKMLPVLGVIVLFAVYWMFIRGGDDDKPKRRNKRPKATQVNKTKTAPVKKGTKGAANKKGAVDAGVAVVKTVDAAPVAPPQSWTIVAGSGGRIEWVAEKGRVIKDDIIVKFRGYGRIERTRAASEKTLKRLQAKLNVISDQLRAAMSADNIASMRRFEKQVQGSQQAVERAEKQLAAAKKRADDLVVRAPGSGVFAPAVKTGSRLKNEQTVGVVKE